MKIKEKCLYRRGYSLLQLSDYWGAKKAFQDVLKLKPTNDAAKDQLNRAEEKIENFQKHSEQDKYAENVRKQAQNDQKHRKFYFRQENPFKIQSCGDGIDYAMRLLVHIYNKNMVNVNYYNSSQQTAWKYSFLSAGTSKLLEEVFSTDELLGSHLLRILQYINYGAFTEMQKFLDHNYLEHKELFNINRPKPSSQQILFHAIIQRRLDNMNDSKALLDLFHSLFPDSNETESALYLFETVLCYQEESPDLYDIKLIIDSLTTILMYNSLDDEIRFDAHFLIAREYHRRRQFITAYNHIASLVYLGNPLYKWDFWLLLSRLFIDLKLENLAFQCLTLSSFSVFKSNNMPSILTFYEQFAIYCDLIHHYNAIEDGYKHLQQVLSKGVLDNDYPTSTYMLNLYDRAVAKVYDIFEIGFLSASDYLYKNPENHYSYTTYFESYEEIMRKYAWEAFGVADIRIFQGWFPENGLIRNTEKSAIKALHIAQNHAYLTYHPFTGKDYGEIVCTIYSTNAHESVSLDICLHQVVLEKRLAAVFNNCTNNQEHDDESSFLPISYFEEMYNSIYLDFIKPILPSLVSKNISNIKIVSIKDFYSKKILFKKFIDRLDEGIVLPQNACYIVYSICRLRKCEIVCYVVFQKQEAHVQRILLTNDYQRFLHDIRYLANPDYLNSDNGVNAKYFDGLTDEEQNELVMIQLKECERIRRDLYEILFKPIVKLLESRTIEIIKIVAESELRQIPFMALMDENDCYLIDKFEISSVMSVRIDNDDKIFESTNVTQFDKVAAFTTTDIHPELEQECGQADESDESYKLSEFSEMITDQLRGPPENRRATKRHLEEFFNNKESQATVFHWCGHTLYNVQEKTQQNYCAISGCMVTEMVSDQQKSMDTLFYSRDIAENYDLSRIKLAFLNSCNTYNGRRVTSSGHLGLARACYNAGASCVIATLVTVFDEAKCFSDLFYEQILNGHSISKSFTEAIRIMKNTRDIGVEGWSNFVLFGNGDLILNIEQ